jgi:hypothetical protein
VGERRRLGGVAGVDPDPARLDALQEFAKGIHVHRLVEAVAEGLAHERVVGELDGPGLILLALGEPGEDGRHQVVGLHALDRRRVAASTAKAQHRERPAQVPAPARREQGRCEHRLGERLIHRPGAEHARERLQREAVLGTEGEHDRVVVGGRLELEVEAATDALAHREPEGAVHATTEGCVYDDLHAAGLVEEALDHEDVAAGHGAQCRARRVEVADDLIGARGVEAGGLAQTGHCARCVAALERRVDLGAQGGHLLGELFAAGGRLAEPEGNGGRGAGRVAHAHHAGLDATDAPGSRAEQEDVSSHALDGPVFVDAADEGVVGIGHDPIVGGVGNRATRGEGRDAGATAPVQQSVDAIPMQMGGATAAAGVDACREHLDDVLEVGVGEGGEGRGPAHHGQEVRLLPGLGGTGRHDLLGENVEGRLGRAHAIEPAVVHGTHQRGALDELVAGGGKQASLGRRAACVAGAADALQEGGDVARRAQLTHELDGTDVDPELEGGRRDEGGEPSLAQPLLHRQPSRPGEAPVVGRHPVLAETLGELVRHPLGEAPGVREDEGGAMRADVTRDAVQDLAPLLRRRDGAELAAGHLDGEIEGATVAHVHDAAAGAAVGIRDVRTGSDQQARNRLDRPLGGGEAHPRWPLLAERLQALEAERQVGAALVARHGVDLVDDHRPHVPQHLAAALGGEQQVERLGGCDQDVGRPRHQGAPLRRLRVTAARLHADLGSGKPLRGRLRADLLKGPDEVLPDVGRQRLEGRHVDDVDGVRERRLLELPVQPVDADEEGRQGLARARRRRDQGVAIRCDQGPALPLRLRGPQWEAAFEPAAQRRVEGVGLCRRRRLTSRPIHEPPRPAVRSSVGTRARECQLLVARAPPRPRPPGPGSISRGRSRFPHGAV